VSLESRDGQGESLRGRGWARGVLWEDGLGDGLIALRLDPAQVTMVVEAVGLKEAEPMVSEWIWNSWAG